jgi:predicted oxidoreductase
MELGQALAKIAILEKENQILQYQNEQLKQNQEAFQNALIAEVQAIEATPKAWRWLQYGKLLFQLIGTIKEAIDKQRAK